MKKAWIRGIVWFILSLGIVIGSAFLMDMPNLVVAVLGLFILYSWCWISCKTCLLERCPCLDFIEKKLKQKK